MRVSQPRKTVGIAFLASWLCVLAIPAILHAQSNTISTVAGGAAAGGPSGTATSAQVLTPTGLAIDGNENIYIGTVQGPQILRLSAAGNISVYAGTTYSASTANGGSIGDGGPATSASFSAPVRVALDAAGNLYVADFAGLRIRKITPAGTITTIAGTGEPCAGPTQPCGDGGPATQATLISPETLAIDGAGNIYVSGNQEMRVRRIDATTGNISTVAGTGNPCTNPTANPACGDNGPATSATLTDVVSLAFDPTGNLYIGDTGAARIRKVNMTTQVITTYAGDGTPCTVAPCGDNGPATSGQVFPLDITFDGNGNLFTVQGTTLREVNGTTQILTTLSGQGSTSGFGGDGGPAAAAFLNSAFAVRVDAVGNIFIADQGNSRVRKVDTTPNRIITTVAGGGNGLPANDNPLDAMLGQPIGVATDSMGDVYFADFSSNFVRELINGDGSFSIVDLAGNGLSLSQGNGGAATSASLGTNGNSSTPAINSAGTLFVGDVNGNVVREVVAATQDISTYAGNGIVCSTPTNACGDGAIALQANFNGPASVALDASGGLLISDGNDFRVRRVDPASGNIAAYAGTGAICNPATACGDGGPALQATFSGAGFLGLAVSGATTYIADAGTARVRAVNANGIISTVAGNGTPCANPANACGDGGAATAANLNFPSAVAVDGKGNLFIADLYKVRRVDAVDGTIATVAGNGTLAYTGDGGPSVQAGIGVSQGVAVDANENLYLSDQFGNRIRTVPMVEVQTITGAFNNFGNQTVGTSGTPQSITLGNTGLNSLVISSAVLSDLTNFTVSNNCPGQQVAPGQTCAISVTFMPVLAGNVTATLTLTTNDSANPSNTFMLQGTGTLAPANIAATGGTPQSATVNTAFAAPLAVTVTDVTGAPVPGVVVTFTAPATGPGGTFAGGVNTATTGANGVANSAVITANATVGAFTVNATVPGVDSSATFSLTNTAATGGGISFSGTTLNFGTEPLADVIIQDQGGTNPNTLGFMGAFGGTAPGSSSNGMWDIPAGPWNTNYDQYNLTAANLTDLTAASGYIFTATFNDLSTNTSPTFPGAPFSYGEDVDVGVNNLRYDLALLSDGNGGQFDSINPFDGTSPTADIPGLGTNPITLTVVFNSSTQLANTYANGVQIITGYAGDSTAFTCNCVVFGGELGDFSNVELVSGLPNPNAILPLTLTNSGSAPLTFSVPATITGTNAGDFTFAPGSTCAFGTALALGNSCVVNILFLPTGAGVRTATLTFFDSATPNSQTITLTGVGQAPLAPANISATGGTPQSATVNTAFAAPLAATVTAVTGAPAAGVVVTFTTPESGGANGSFPGNAFSATATTNANGVATSPAFTANGTVGTYIVTATVPGVDSSANFSLTNTAATTPASITVVSGTPQSATINTAFAAPFVVSVQTAAGAPVSGAIVSFDTPEASGANGTFPGGTVSATATTNAKGQATSPILTANNSVGTFTVTAFVAGTDLSANFALTNTSSSGSSNLTINLPGPGPVIVPLSTLTFTFNVQSVGGLAGTVNTTCASATVGCFVSPCPAPLTANHAVLLTTTLCGCTPSGGSLTNFPRFTLPLAWRLALAFLACLLLAALIATPKKNTRWAFAAASLAFALIAGCGGGTTHLNANGSAALPVAPGQYTLTITAKSGNVTQSSQVTVSVQ